MALSALTPLSQLTAIPPSIKPTALVTFQIALKDPGAPPAGNSRELTLSIDSENQVFFAGDTKSTKHSKTILASKTDVSITESIIEKGPGTLPGVNVSMFDDTGKLLGFVLVALL